MSYWWLLDRAHRAGQKLEEKRGWGQHEIDKLSQSVAIDLVFRDEKSNGDAIEVVVEMRDQLPYERLIELPAAQQIALRKDHANASQSELTRSLQLGEEGRTHLQLWLSNQFVVSLNPFDILRAVQSPDVGRVTSSLPVRACINEGFPRVCSPVTARKYTGRNQIVALIDSGIDSTHVDLKGRVEQKKDYVGNGFADENGHGSHLAGIVGANCTSYMGVAPKVTLWSYRALDKDGESATQANLTQAIQDLVVDASEIERTVVANCSFEVPTTSLPGGDYDAFCKPFDDATTSLVVVAAAGNCGPEISSITAPGGGFRVLTVGASVNRPAGFLDVVSPFSSRGPATYGRQKPDVVAPGGFANPEGDANANVSMISSRVAGSTLDMASGRDKPWQVDSDHYGISGTSQAAALVSGVCALILEDGARKKRTPRHFEIANALKSTARKLGYSRQEEGFGIIDVDAAITAL